MGRGGFVRTLRADLDPRRLTEATNHLLARVAARGLVVAGSLQISRYDPPWTPWFLRRNEVMVPVTAT
jgi:hypothetical protein